MKVLICAIFVLMLKLLFIYSKKLSGRVINGKLATLGQFPWFVSLDIDRSWACGGTLISSKWVLTAAHCLNSTSKTYCYFGSLDQGRGLEVVGKNIVIHPKYNRSSFEHDVALIELSFRIYYNDTIRLIRLAKKWMTYKYFLNRSMTFAGTGINNIDEEPRRLRYTRLKVIPPQECDLDTIDPPEMRVCAKAIDKYSGKNTCKGDSGSGLLYRYKKKHYVVGVFSAFFFKCEDVNQTSIFQSVQMHLDWIKSTLGVFQFPN